MVGTLLASIFLAGCSSIPLGTMLKMRNFDPLSAEPSSIRFAVITDKQVRLADGSTSMTLSFQSTQPDRSFTHTAVASIKEYASIESLPTQLQPHEKVTLFFLKKEDADALRLAQSKLRNIKALNVDGSGSLSISVTQGCLPAQLLKSNEMLVTVFAQFDPSQGYVKMISEMNLLSQASAETLKNWTDCKSLES